MLQYKRAADLGNARAIYNVGLFNEKGILIPKNEKLARGLCEKSALMGDDIGMINLARLLAKGWGTQGHRPSQGLAELGGAGGQPAGQANPG